MNRIFTKALFLLLPFTIISSTSKNHLRYDIKSIEKEVLVKLNDSLYISRFETTNFEYLMFNYRLWVKGDTASYHKFRSDSSLWFYESTEVYIDHYHVYPGFRYFPVVGISFEAAQAFCKDLTELYNNTKERKFKKVIFRLPSEEEWLLAAGKYKDSLYAMGNDTLDSKGMFRYDFEVKWYSREKLKELRAEDYPAYMMNSEKNELGIYQLSGNVSEMLNEKGKSKGGSWKHTATESTLQAVQYYTEPNLHTGFRYVMQVIEK